MTAEEILAVGAAVIPLTQLAKWMGVDKRAGPLLVLLISALAVAVFAWSQDRFSQTNVWPLVAGWVTVSVSAAGVYGFARSTAEEVTRLVPARRRRGE